MTMKLNTVANRYICREMVPPFLLNLLFFTFIFLLTRILDITNMVVNYKIGLDVILRMLLFAMPYFLVFVIPMSTMMAVLLTFLRMSSDNEILALKSGGVSLYGTLPAVLTFCLAGSILTAATIAYGLPWGRLALRDLTVQVAAENVDIGLKERTFNDSFRGVMLYVNRIDVRTKALMDIFIQDDRDGRLSVTIIAPRGQLFGGGDTPAFRLRLFDGSINQVDLTSRTVNSARFETYDLHLDLQQAMVAARSGPKDDKEMYPAELRRFIKTRVERDVRYYQALLEWHKKFSIPVACLALGILAVPLGVGAKFSRRSFGLGIGLTFFLFYYLLLSAGLVFGETGAYPAAVGMWIPNLVTGGLGIFLFIRAAADRPVRPGFVPYAIHRLKARFRRPPEARP